MTTMNDSASLIQSLEAMIYIRVADGRSGRTGWQEAAAVGVMQALTARDLILTNRRRPEFLLTSATGPASVDPPGVVLASPIVGGELALATGLALSTQLRRDGVIACFFEENGTLNGLFQESLSQASQWHLPILYVCGTAHGQESVVTHARQHGVSAYPVDGADLEAIADAASSAAAEIRRTGKPALLAISSSRRDPITLLERRLVARGTLSEPRLTELYRQVRRAVESRRGGAIGSNAQDEQILAA
jgi:pyruvate dehydrogenase E1 component alpha subunit